MYSLDHCAAKVPTRVLVVPQSPAAGGRHGSAAEEGARRASCWKLFRVTWQPAAIPYCTAHRDCYVRTSTRAPPVHQPSPSTTPARRVAAWPTQRALHILSHTRPHTNTPTLFPWPQTGTCCPCRKRAFVVLTTVTCQFSDTICPNRTRLGNPSESEASRDRPLAQCRRIRIMHATTPASPHPDAVVLRQNATNRRQTLSCAVNDAQRAAPHSAKRSPSSSRPQAPVPTAGGLLESFMQAACEHHNTHKTNAHTHITNA